MPSYLRAIAAAMMSLLAACADAPAGRPLTSAAAWHVDSVPIFDIGADPADDTLALIGNAVAAYALGDSQVVVADRGFNQLRYFDRGGALIRTAGGEGDGPGETRYLGRMLRCGDSLYVQEMQRRTMMIFSAAGVHARDYPLSGPDSRFNLPYRIACAPSGAMVASGWDTIRVREWSRVRGTVPYWLTDPTGAVTTVLGSWPGSERLTGPNGSGPHPLGKEAVLAYGRGRVYIGTADSFAIEVLATDGTPLAPIVKPNVVLATTEADIARHRLLDTLGKDDRRRASAMRGWERFEYPETIPAYTALVVDRDDNLWVRAFPRSTENVVRWVVFDPRGAEIGSVDLPGTLEVFDIGSDWVLGIETRLTDGGQQVRMYRFHRD